MSKKALLAIAGVLTGILSSVAIWLPNAEATTTPHRINGITISPAFQEIRLDAGKSSETFNFSVTNSTSEPYEFALSVVDFGSLDESGGVLFIGEAEKQLDYRYGLSSWAVLERDRIVVEPKSTQKVPVTITNKESLTPGGHYGAVLVTPVGADDRPTKVQINQVLSSLLFVSKRGGEIYNFDMLSYDVQTQLFKPPGSVELRFQNAGNMHAVPRGTVIVTDPVGREVRRGIINTGSAIVLPETFRKIQVELTATATAWIPGTYTMTITHRFDGQDQTKTQVTTFFYINAWYLIAASFVFAGIVGVVVNRRLRRAAVRIAGLPFRMWKTRRRGR